MTDVTHKRLALAEHYLEINRPERALETLETADVELGEAEPWELRAQALFDLERYTEGIAAAQRGLEVEPEDITLLDLLALNSIEAGDYAQAERALLAALELAPDHPDLLAHYGLACARVGQRRKAERLIEEASRIDPESVETLRARAQVAWLVGNRRRARQYVDELLAADPEDRVGHALRGNLELDRNIRKSVSHFEEAARLDPSDREIAYVARYNKTLVHPLLWPVYPIQRFGPIKVWAGGLTLIALAGATGIKALTIGVTCAYLFMVVYSWTLAPLARWWLRRRIPR